MGILSGLKSALSKLGDFDRRMSYGPDYDAKARVLASLNDLKTQGVKLENEAKFQRIQQIRGEMAGQEQDRTAESIDRAVKLGKALPTRQDQSFVGPRLEDAGLPNTGGEGLVEDQTPLDLFNIPENARGTVMAAARQARGAREGEERYVTQKRTEEKESADALQTERNANAFRKMHPVTGGGTGVRNGRQVQRSEPMYKEMPDGSVIYGASVTYKDGTREFVADAQGVRPYNSDASQQDRDALIGAGNAYNDLEDLIGKFEKADAAGLLGPLVGNAANFSAKHFGGAGLSEDQRVLIQSIDRTKTLAAFAEGGKALTGTEKEFFDQNYPTLASTTDPKVFVRLARELQSAIRRGVTTRTMMMPPQRRPSQIQLDRVFPTQGSSKGTLVQNPDGTWERK